MTEILLDGPDSSEKTIVLAHGAGAGMDSEYLQVFAEGLSGVGLRVARFEFPYMLKRRADGRRRPPDRMPVLLDTYLQVVSRLGPENLIIGGKSMGGRIASMIANETGVAGLVCLGYPFHPPGRPEKLRTQHLETLVTPTLILQGDRDPFGKRLEVEAYTLSTSIKLVFLPDGDHDLRPRKSSGRSRDDNWREAILCIAEFAKKL